MAKEKITIAGGMELSQGEDGDWLHVKTDGMYAVLNLESGRKKHYEYQFKEY